jgi:hypothetical protein
MPVFLFRDVIRGSVGVTLVRILSEISVVCMNGG